nr:hypothetical protein [Brachybacterium sacelli]
MAGWVLIAPVAGLIFGLMSLGSEPAARGRAGWGVVLNILAMVGWIIAVVLLAVTGVGLGIFHGDLGTLFGG